MLKNPIVVSLTCLLAVLPNAHATENDTNLTLIKNIISLAKDGEFMNLKTVSERLDEPNLYGQAIFQSSEFDPNHLNNNYQSAKPIGLSIHHHVLLDMASGFYQVSGMATFYLETCPSIATFEHVSQNKAEKISRPTPPSLNTGQGGYLTEYYLIINNNKQKERRIVITPDSENGCEISMFTDQYILK